MESLYLLIPLSILFLMAGVGVWFWAVKSGQYDDLDGEAEKILFDDDHSDSSDSQQSNHDRDRDRDSDPPL